MNSTQRHKDLVFRYLIELISIKPEEQFLAKFDWHGVWVLL